MIHSEQPEVSLFINFPSWESQSNLNLNLAVKKGNAGNYFEFPGVTVDRLDILGLIIAIAIIIKMLLI